MPKNTGKKLADMLYGDNPERAAFGVYPQAGKRGQRQPSAKQQLEQIFSDDRAMDLPQFGDVDLSVPTAANRALGQRMTEREVGLKRQADRDMSPLEKLAGGMQAGRLMGSGLVQAAKSIPTAITKGGKAAEEYIAENIYKPTQPKAYEYAGDVGDFLTSLETDYKLPPMMPEAMALQHLLGPATQQARKAVPQAVRQGALNLAAPRTLNPQAGVIKTPGVWQFDPNEPTPGIVVPGKINNVREAVRNLKGNYGAMRVERAADEIRNLEKMYSEDALKELFTGDNAQAVVTMNPADFERYAKELGGRSRADIGPKMAERAKQGEIDKYTVPTDEYIQHLMRVRGGFDQAPYLSLFKDEVGIPSKPEVRGHEGRHRSRALSEAGETAGLVQISPRGDLREGLPRRTQEEYIEALKEELEQSGRLVLPEADGSYRRPAIELPEVYAEGGPVHFSDSPDVMQLELAGGGLVKKLASTVGKAAESAGMKAPVTASKDLTTLQDVHTNLGDRVRAGAMEAQKMMEGFGYQYDKGQRVFTKDSAGKNKPPYTILNRTRVGNQVMREDHPEFGPGMGRPIIDPETGKAMRTPYEPGYRVRMERGPDDWSEFEIPEKAIVGDVEMAGGGLVKGLARLARAPAKTKAEIEALAERLAPQVTGEYVRKDAKSAKTVADKTQKQFQREKTLPVDVRPTAEVRTPQPVDIEKLRGEVMIGVPGDPTLTGKTLYSVGDVKLDSPSPQHGGPQYGLYNDEGNFWASGIGAARRVQNLAREAGQQYDAPVLGNYIMMGPESINYAQHFADANLQAIDLSKMTKKQVDQFNKLIRFGSNESGPRPNFPGIEDKGEAYLQMAMDPPLRKHFNALMQQPTVTEALNLPSGTDIRFAITEPSLRDLETGVTGYSMGRMRPDISASELKLSQHPTYSHDIPGQFIGESKYPMPYELSFPDTLKTIREDPKQAPHEFGSLKMVGPRQIIDQQMIDEIRAYEERMKQLTGKKAGGAVRKAEGGGITADDLILEERKL